MRRLILVGTGPRGGEGMAQLAPDVAPAREWGKRRADPLPGLQPRIALPVHRALQPLHERIRRSRGRLSDPRRVTPGRRAPMFDHATLLRVADLAAGTWRQRRA